ncbi:MAG: hypothetical protein IT314_06145 [Anaerolineales bacterium]|nr:hypothetical protein [Anaerolineales bacterium]
MNALLAKLPSLFAFLVGVMSILAGGMVLRGWQPGWNVITWLPAYNFVVGLWTLIPAYLLWINHRYAFAASIVTFGLHAIVILLLLTVFRNTAAFQSLGAMTFRVVTWIAILVLWFRR